MRRITVISMITLDGILQGPGNPTEDTSGDFMHGGWAAPYDDEVGSKILERLLKPAEYLLGRKTFEIWENYWPEHGEYWPGINEGSKYILSNSRTKSSWKHTVFLRTLAEIKELKSSQGADLQVWGSGQLNQLLFENDLVDELWLMIHPLTLGKGKQLFDKGVIPAAFTLKETTVTTTGVIMACYERGGDVKTGIAGPESD